MIYPKPKHNGGKIISAIVQRTREYRGSAITAVACSGGPDSMALLHAIVKYGKNVCDLSKLIVLHVNHNLRGEESLRDQEFVQDYASSHGLLCHTYNWKPESESDIENQARMFRQKIYRDYPVVLTGHHKDDVAETVFWRFLRGELSKDSGILPVYGTQVRPLLGLSKSTLIEFLKEEGIPYRVDQTNLDGSNMRSWLRTHILPEIRRKYPGIDSTLFNYSNLGNKCL